MTDHELCQHVYVTTAQEFYADAVRTVLRPRLEALGLRAAANRFTLPSKTHFAQIGLQKSVSSDRCHVKFTANIDVTDRDLWKREREAHPSYPPRPSPNVLYSRDQWHVRVKAFLPTDHDHWWTIDSPESATAAMDDLAFIVEHFVLPELRRRVSCTAD